MKLQSIQNYLDLVKEQDKTREAIALLKNSTSDPSSYAALTKDFSKITSLIEELDADQSNASLHIKGNFGTFEKLQKTASVFDEQIRQNFLVQYGIDGISFSSIEQVYNPLVTGIATMAQTRAHLVRKGMTPDYADQLAAKYIKNLEHGQVVRVMDFFDTKRDDFKAMQILSDAPLESVAFNYQTLASYSRELNFSHA
mgnify:CR=1 FL=1